MCLTLRPLRDSVVPHNKSNIRWKRVLATRCRDSFGRFTSEESSLRSLFMDKSISRHDLNVCKNPNDDAKSAGIHVYVNRYDAVPYFEDNKKDRNVRIIKIKCFGFKRSGEFSTRKSETWNSYRVLEVYTVAQARKLKD